MLCLLCIPSILKAQFYFWGAKGNCNEKNYCQQNLIRGETAWGIDHFPHLIQNLFKAPYNISATLLILLFLIIVYCFIIILGNIASVFAALLVFAAHYFAE